MDDKTSLRAELIAKFKVGMTPTSNDFEDLIDGATDASALIAGTLSNDRLSETLETKAYQGESATLTGHLQADSAQISEHLQAKTLEGDGSKLKSLNATEITSGTLSNSRLEPTVETSAYKGEKATLTGHLEAGSARVSDHFQANTLEGDGAKLENLNASELTTGTVSNDRLEDTVKTTSFVGVSASLTGSLEVNSAKVTTHLEAKTLEGDGSQLVNLNASEIKSGTLSNERLESTVKTNAIKVKNLESDVLDVTGKIQADSGVLTSHLKAGSFEGNAALLSDLAADSITTGKVSNDRLNQANKTRSGIARFATQKEIEGGADNLAVTAMQLDAAISATRQYIDSELTFLEAGFKFKKGVKVVAEREIDLSASQDYPLIDGYQIEPGDRVLFAAQNNTSENKVWVAQTDGQWKLADDFDGVQSNELYVGVSVEVLAGDNDRQSIWSVTECGDSQGFESIELTWSKRNDINKYQGSQGIIVDGLNIKTDATWLESQITSTAIPSENISGLNSAARGEGQFGIEQFPTGTVASNSSSHLPTSAETKAYVDTKVKNATDQAMPIGAIIMWSGNTNTIPEGWALCNGAQGTPNLINRFIVGAGGTYGVGATGGASSVTLTAAQSGMPSHTVSGSTYSAGSHYHSFNDYHYYDDSGNDPKYATKSGDDTGHLTSTTHTTGSAGSHAHSFSVSVSSRNASQSHENRPPYYALCYIMRIS